MPKGFSGASAKRFFERTNEAMTKASEAHNRRPFEDTSKGLPGYYKGSNTYGMAAQGLSGSMTQGMYGTTKGTYDTTAMYGATKGMYDPALRSRPRITLPSFPEPRNHKMPFSPEDANPFNDRHKTGIGNRSNIVVEQSIYEDVIKKIDMADDKAGEEIYKMCCKIEEMCKTIYIVPETIPRIMALTSRLKDSMPQFRGLTEEVNIQIRKFVNEIGNVDQAPDGFKVVVSDEGAEHVIGSTKDAVGKQIQSMEDTARSYAQAAESLRQQAESLRKQADTTKNQIDMLEGRIKMLEEREAMERAAALGNPLGGASPFRVVRD